MAEIQAVIFDVGGVYLQGSFVDFVNRGYRALSIEKTYSASEEITFDEDFNKGHIGAEECFTRYFGVPITNIQMQDILKLWKSTWKLQPEMSGLVKKLRENHRLSILSNSDPVNSLEYSRKGWYDPFEVLVLSHVVGIIKPDKRIYELTLERLKTPGESCVFIDDQERNLIPAQELGMKTVLYKTLEQLTRELAKIGVKIN